MWEYSCNCSRTTRQVSPGVWGRRNRPTPLHRCDSNLTGFGGRTANESGRAIVSRRIGAGRQTFLSSATDSFSGEKRNVRRHNMPSPSTGRPDRRRCRPLRAPQNAGQFRTRSTAESYRIGPVAISPNGERRTYPNTGENLEILPLHVFFFHTVETEKLFYYVLRFYRRRAALLVAAAELTAWKLARDCGTGKRGKTAGVPSAFGMET